MSSAPYSASTIAKWFLAWADFEEEGALSNLKLQKLLYYAKGHYMATHDGRPLFEDAMQAWSHGPVVPSVYHEYKTNGSNAIDASNLNFRFTEVDDDTSVQLESVWETFGSKSAWKLREMTHQESPWVESFRDGERNVEISDDALMKHFSALYIRRPARHSAR